jgi:hypothetical protein
MFRWQLKLVQRCKRFIETILGAADLQRAATASVAIFDQMRDGARAMLQATVDLEAHQLHSRASCLAAPRPSCRTSTPAWGSPPPCLGRLRCPYVPSTVTAGARPCALTTPLKSYTQKAKLNCELRPAGLCAYSRPFTPLRQVIGGTDCQQVKWYPSFSLPSE